MRPPTFESPPTQGHIFRPSCTWIFFFFFWAVSACVLLKASCIVLQRLVKERKLLYLGRERTLIGPLKLCWCLTGTCRSHIVCCCLTYKRLCHLVCNLLHAGWCDCGGGGSIRAALLSNSCSGTSGSLRLFQWQRPSDKRIVCIPELFMFAIKPGHLQMLQQLQKHDFQVICKKKTNTYMNIKLCTWLSSDIIARRSRVPARPGGVACSPWVLSKSSGLLSAGGQVNRRR